MPYDAGQPQVQFLPAIRDAPIVTEGPFKIDTSTQLRPARKKHLGLSLWLLGILGLLVISVVAFDAFVKRNSSSTDGTKSIVPLVETEVVEVPSNDIPIDESQVQWISPTSGPPITLEYIPLGTQAILYIRPAELMAHAEGEKVLAAQGPWGAWAVEQIEQSSGMKLGEIETLLVALHRDEDAWQCTLRMTLVTTWTQQKLKQRTTEFSNQNHALFSPK